MFVRKIVPREYKKHTVVEFPNRGIANRGIVNGLNSNGTKSAEFLFPVKARITRWHCDTSRERAGMVVPRSV